MVFGLTNKSYNQYRIHNNSKEGYVSPKNTVGLSFTANGLIYILEILLTFIAIIATVDLYLIHRWNIWLSVVFFVLFFIPVLGDVLSVVIIVYWLVRVRNGDSVLVSKYGSTVSNTLQGK